MSYPDYKMHSGGKTVKKYCGTKKWLAKKGFYWVTDPTAYPTAGTMFVINQTGYNNNGDTIGTIYVTYYFKLKGNHI